MGKVKHRDVIYDGIHKALVSETIFNLAQDLHKEKVKKHRIYRNHFFGGFIYCECCGYSMTPVFTNKKSKGKVVRYFYYRCLSTLKRDWNSCSTKQISANKLENFFIESLKRIFNDDIYLENLVFRLNNDKNAPLSRDTHFLILKSATQ